MKNLIIGLISGYDFESLRPFFDTLESSGYRGDVLLFHDQLKPQTVAELRKRNVKLKRFRKANLPHPVNGTQLVGYGRLDPTMARVQEILQSLPGKRMLLTALGRRLYHIVNIRFLLAEEALRSGELDAYDRIMFTDVRDVVFQRDPFDFDDHGRVMSFLEPPIVTLDTHPLYRGWISASFGEQFAAKYGTRRVSCCAITTGPRRQIRAYFSEFVRLLQSNTTVEPFRFGMDSAIHNRIIWESLVPDMEVVENLQGPVAHLAVLKRDEIPVNAAGKLVNRDGSVINVVHQYDRHADLAQLLLQ